MPNKEEVNLKKVIISNSEKNKTKQTRQTTQKKQSETTQKKQSETKNKISSDFDKANISKKKSVSSKNLANARCKSFNYKEGFCVI